MPPSTSYFPMCCCTRKPKRSDIEESKNGDISIHLNGKQQLTVPRIAILNGSTVNDNGSPSLGNGQIIDNKVYQNGDIKREYAQRRVSESSITMEPDEVFETARTSRQGQVEHQSMAELMRCVRLEEGLPVTSRDHRSPPEEVKGHPGDQVRQLQRQPVAPHPQPLNVEVLITSNASRPRRAVFNDDGDISARTASPVSFSPRRVAGRFIKSNTSASSSRRQSVITISHNDVIKPLAPPTPSTVQRSVSAAPQMIFTIVGIVYTWMTSLLTLFGNSIFK